MTTFDWIAVAAFLAMFLVGLVVNTFFRMKLR